MKWLAVVILLCAVVLAWWITYMPIAAAGAIGFAALIGIGSISVRHTREALSASFFVVLLAGSDFRMRDPYESVRVAIDVQVAFELGVYFLLVLLAVRAVRLIPKDQLRFTISDWFLLVYATLAAFSVLWSPIKTFTAVRSLQIWTLLFLSYVCVRAIGPARTLKAIGISVVVYVIVLTVVAVPVNGHEWLRGDRLSWFTMHAIYTGALSAVGAIFMIAVLQFRDPEDRHRGLKWCILALLCLMLVLSQSRGPILAFVVATSSMVALRYSPRLARVTAIGLFGVTILVALSSSAVLQSLLGFAASSDNPVLNFLFRGQTAEEFASLTGRLELWAGMRYAFWRHPFFGHGYQASRVVGMAILPWAGEAHNALAQSLLDLGLVGTMLLFFVVLRALFGSYAAASGYGSGAIPYQVAIFGFTLFLLINSIITASFTGIPGIEPLLLFVCIMAGEQLRLSCYSYHDVGGRPSPGTLDRPTQTGSVERRGCR